MPFRVHAGVFAGLLLLAAVFAMPKDAAPPAEGEAALAPRDGSSPVGPDPADPAPVGAGLGAAAPDEDEPVTDLQRYRFDPDQQAIDPDDGSLFDGRSR